MSKMISVLLSLELLDRMAKVNRPQAELIREAVVLGLEQGIAGQRRRRHSARKTCRQTTLLIDEALHQQMNQAIARGGRNLFIEQSVERYLSNFSVPKEAA